MPLPYLLPRGLEQASSELVARERARRISGRLPDSRILDATCGIGADLIALNLAGQEVVGADRDRECLSMARGNLRHHGLPVRLILADATRPAARAELLYLDPDRRVGGARSLDPRRWSPDLDTALALAASFQGGCLKLAPGLDAELLIDAEARALPAGLPRRREWISRAGELVELCLWTGALAEGEEAERVATRLERSGATATLLGTPEPIEAHDESSASRVAWLAEPDPAVIRSGLLGNLARSTGLAPLASEIAYLGGADRPESPFLRVWRVLGSTSLDPRRVRELLREHDVGPITVRKRGHPDRPEVLQRRLRGRGSRHGELVVARLARGHRAYLVEAARAREAPGRDELVVRPKRPGL